MFDNGFLQDCTITLIDKTDGSHPTRREGYWRGGLKTVAPYGLNRIRVSFLTPLHYFIYFFAVRV